MAIKIIYTLVFRPRQLWIGGGEGAYFFCLEETAVGRKRLKIDGIVSAVLSGVVAWYELCMRNQTQHINFEKLMEINFALEKMYSQNIYISLIRSSGMGNCLFLHAWGWWVDNQAQTKLQILGVCLWGHGNSEPAIKYEVIFGFQPHEKARGGGGTPIWNRRGCSSSRLGV